MKKVNVVIIGAGTAGLSALKQVQRIGKSFLLIDSGEHGTTCARVGCMPSKAIIYTANMFHSRHEYSRLGIDGEELLSINTKSSLNYIRSLRDYFVSFVIDDINKLGDNFIDGNAKFIDRNHILVNEMLIEFDSAVIATGTSPVIPNEWMQFRDRLITTDEIFELEVLPKTLAVIGMGAVGLELGQALHRLGVKLYAFNRGKKIGNIRDDKINQHALDVFTSEFELNTGQTVSINGKNNHLIISTENRSIEVQLALISLGRKPNLDRLDIHNLHISLDKKGIPKFNIQTMQIEDTNIFIAGDVNGHNTILHEASDEGKIAGYNACIANPKSFHRKISFLIIFTDPNIISVGENIHNIDDSENYIVGESEFIKTGRPLIEGSDKGLLRIFAEKNSGKLVSATMIGPGGEHIAHLLAWAITKEMTVIEMLNMPYYHPVVEEFIFTALKDLIKKIESEKLPVLGMKILD